jgi:long-subunit fatty acid transport protein
MKFFETTYAKLISVALLMLTLCPLHSQYNPNSVYSRFGLGLLDNPGNVTHYGMGGITSPISDPIALNLANPASYSFLEVTNLQATLKGLNSKASTNAESTSYLNGQIHELSMGFKKPNAKWALAMGLTPYSSVDYRFSAKDTLSDTLFASYNYSGRGGINKATLGFSRLFRIGGITSGDSTGKRLHQVSLGVNAHYIFGNITRENVVAFSQSEHYTTVENHNLWVKGIAWEAGLQYKVNLSTRRDPQNRIIGGSALQVGCSYSLNADLSAEYSELLYSLRITSNTALRDTAHFLDALDGRLKIPKKLQAGIAYKLFNKKWGTFVIAGEYRLQDWSNYRLEISEDVNLDKGLQESSGWAVGMEYKPTTDVNNNFFNRLYYRAGYRSAQTELVINSVRIKQEVTTAGVTIPVIRSQSKIHLGAEWGTRGTREANLVEEKYVGFMIGFSLSPSSFDRWFRQVKYD